MLCNFTKYFPFWWRRLLSTVHSNNGQAICGSYWFRSAFPFFSLHFSVGICLWERQTCDQKVASSNPSTSSRRIFFSKVNSVLTLILCPFHLLVTVVAHKRPWSFCKKCRWQVTPKRAYTLAPSKLGWLCSCPGKVWESIRKWAHMQLIREHLVTVVSAHWATVDWSWPKEWN